MKKLFRFALAALATAAMFVSCEDELKPEEKPDDKDQKVELKGISLDKTTATVKVGETATLKVLYNPDNATEKPAATWTSDTPAVATVADGVVTGVAAGEAKITATVGTFTATATITVTEDAVPSKYPLGLVDWDNLNKDYLVSLELPEGAAMTGLKSAKLYYDDKLYILAEISDEAVADGKVRMHVYFDVDKTGKLQQHWDKAAIDYMTEGKITNSGAYVSYSSTLYKWDGTPEDPWKWADSGLAPTCVGDGKDNLYEMSLDYAAFADKMPVAFNIGLDVVNSSWATFGFLPSVAEGTPKLARIVKAGQTDPGEEEEDTWDYTPSAEYLAEGNLWKAVDANHTIAWYFNPNWAGEKPAPEVTFQESTYKVNIADATSGDWQAQMWIVPGEDFKFQPLHKYSISATLYATKETKVFIKMYQKGVDWPESFETPAQNRLVIPAETMIPLKLEGFLPILTPQSILVDFGGNPADVTVYIKDITITDDGAVDVPALKAEWLFTADAAVADETSYGYTFSAGEQEFKADGSFNGMKPKADKAAGDGGLYVKSNVSAGGLLQYFQVDKAQLDTAAAATRTVGSTGHPFVTGQYTGDCWLFTLKDEVNETVFPAGTKVHINFLTRISKTGMKYWTLEYWNGYTWVPTTEMKTETVGEGDAAQTINYNFEPTTATSNSKVDFTWTLDAPTPTPMFRYTCAGNWKADGKGAVEAVNGGTNRIAGASGTSPIFEIVPPAAE